MSDLFRTLSVRIRRPVVVPNPMADFPCAVCGSPAASWEYHAETRAGEQVIEGWPVCEAHAQFRERKAAG